MQFQNAILTEEGVRILQSGIANNPVVFTRFLFTASPTPLTAQTVNLPEPTWGNGHVTNYAAGGNGFVLYMMATNDTDYGYAYGFGVYGYLQNEGVENEKLLIVANYAGNVTYVSEASGSYTRFHLAITVSLSMSNSVLTIAPSYDDLVSNTAFQDLLERTVTTHSAADPMVGDPQIVRGQKHFYNTTYFGGESNAPRIEIDVDSENGSMYLNAEHSSQQIRIQMKPKLYGDDSNNNVYVNTNISPSGDGLVSLGSNEHRWLELNTYYVWASDTIGVSDQYGSTGVKSSGVEFLNGEGDSIGSIGLNNDGTRLLIEGNGDPVHIAYLTVDGSANVTSSLSVSGPIYTNGIIYANENIQCSGAISASDGVTVGSVTMTGNGNVLAINKSVNVSSSLTCAQLFMTSNVMGINGAGGEPYYIGVNNGVLQIGMNNSGTNISGGGLKVSALNAAGITTNGMRYAAGIDTQNFPIATLDNVPIGAVVEVYIPDHQFPTNEEVRILPGEKLTGYELEAFVTKGNRLLYGDNSFPLPDTDGSHYRTLSPITHRYVLGEDNGVTVWVIKVE